MKIRVPQRDIADAVNKVKTVVSSKSALPILTHVLMETVGGTVKLSATDLKVGIECTVDCTVDEPGSLTVSCQRLASVLAELPEADVEIALGENGVVDLRCAKSEYQLFSMSPDEFPPIRTFEGIDAIVIPQMTLREILSKVSFAICTDQARYNLTGLLVDIKDGKLTAVATDGKRMSLYIETEGIPDDVTVKVIVPGKMIAELERLLDNEGPVEIFIDENQAAFVFGSIRMVSALIEGTFPNYEMVIPKKHDKEIVLNTQRFAEAMRRTRTMTNEKFNTVRVKLGSGLITLKVVTPEVGEYEEDVEVEYDGSALEVAFNPDFILDILRHVTTEKMILLLKDATNPGVLKPYTEAAVDRYVNVVMPIRA